MDLNLKIGGTRNPKLPWLVSLTRTSLDELEQEYLRVGAESCGHLRQQTQLSAFLLCGIRSLSLLRGMLRLLEPTFLDSHATLHRTFLESWYLQFEFRLKTKGGDQVTDWFHPNSKLYKARRGVLDDFLVQLGGKALPFDLEYKALSNATHPTNEAAHSSELVVTATSGMSEKGQVRLREALHKLSDLYIGLLSRELWLSFLDHPGLIETGFRRDRLNVAYELNDLFVVKQSKIDWGGLR